MASTGEQTVCTATPREWDVDALVRAAAAARTDVVAIAPPPSDMEHVVRAFVDAARAKGWYVFSPMHVDTALPVSYNLAAVEDWVSYPEGYRDEYDLRNDAHYHFRNEATVEHVYSRHGVTLLPKTARIQLENVEWDDWDACEGSGVLVDCIIVYKTADVVVGDGALLIDDTEATKKDNLCHKALPPSTTAARYMGVDCTSDDGDASEDADSESAEAGNGGDAATTDARFDALVTAAAACDAVEEKPPSPVRTDSLPLLDPEEARKLFDAIHWVGMREADVQAKMYETFADVFHWSFVREFRCTEAYIFNYVAFRVKDDVVTEVRWN